MVNPEDLFALEVVGVACCFLAAVVLIVEFRERRRARYGVSVRSMRQGRNSRVDIRECDGGRRRVIAHGVVWLDQENIARAGDPLFFSPESALNPISVILLGEQLEHSDRPDPGVARHIVLADDRGAAFYMEWTGDASVDSGGLVVLWTLDRRRRGAAPVVLRDDQAAEWLAYLKDPDASPPPAPPIRFALLAVVRQTGLYLLDTRAAKKRSAADRRGDAKRDGDTRVWVHGVIAGLLLLVVSLVVLDLIDIRQYVRLSADYDWLAFIGAIVGGVVGGLVTFGGVLLTLRNAQSAERSRQAAETLRNRLSMLPLFEMSVSYDPKHFDNSAGQLAEEPGTPVFSIDGASSGDEGALHFRHALLVSNVGLGHALLTAVEYTVGDSKGNVLAEQNTGFVNFLVKNGSSRTIRAYFVAPRDNPRFEDPRQNAYNVVVTLRYQDLIANTYHQVVRTVIYKGLSAGEDPRTGGTPVSSLSYAEPPIHDESAAL